MTGPKTLCYRLEGESHRSATILDSIAREYFNRNLQAPNGRNFADIQKEHEEANAYILSEVKARAPELFEACGFGHESICVRKPHGLFYRSYKQSPDIFAAPTEKAEYYMYVPVDYKGEHFVPKDAVLLNEKEAERAGNLLFAGGWLGNAPILSSPDAGCHKPADFDPNKHDFWEPDERSRQQEYRYFKAGGLTLELLEDFQHRQAEVAEDRNAIIDYIKSELNYILREGVENKLDLRRNYSLGFLIGRNREDGSLEIECNVQQTDGGFGERIVLKDNDLFDIEPAKEGRRPTIKPHDRTKKAAKLKSMMDAIWDDPHYGDYKDLIYPEEITPVDNIDAMVGASRTPIVKTIANVTYLLYRKNPDRPDPAFCPPGSEEIDPLGCLWLECDESDKKRGITSPPIEDHRILNAVRAHIKINKPQGKKPKNNGPKP